MLTTTTSRCLILVPIAEDAWRRVSSASNDRPRVSSRSVRKPINSARTATIAAKRTRVFMNQNRTTRCSVTTGATPALSAILNATLRSPQVAE